MKATGIVRRIDDLGRVVIPKEIRRTMRIREGDPLLTTLTGAERYIRAVGELAETIGKGHLTILDLSYIIETQYEERSGMSNYLVTFYTKPDGSKPVSEFIQSLEPKMQAKVIRSLEILEANGPTLREPYTKALGDGIFELRIQAAGDISRVLYFYVLGHTIIATHGFIKKTRKTPPAELRLAKTYRADYMRRMKEEHT